METVFKIRFLWRILNIGGGIFVMSLVGFMAFIVSSYMLWMMYCLFVVVVVFGGIRFSFYIILTKDRVILQNGICSFLRKEFHYTEIEKIEFGGGRELLQMFLAFDSFYAKIQTPFGEFRYLLGFVERNSYKELVDILREKGVKVNVDRLGKNLKRQIEGQEV